MDLLGTCALLVLAGLVFWESLARLYESAFPPPKLTRLAIDAETMRRCMESLVRTELASRYAAVDVLFGAVFGRNSPTQREPDRRYPN